MRRSWLVGSVAVGVLALAGVAFAQDVTNTYSVSHSVSPSKAGTKRRPLPISVNLGFKVGEVQGRRPGVVNKYSIKTDGLVINTAFFPKCSTSTLEGGGPSACPRGSRMGRGFIRNATGNRADPNDKSIACNTSVELYNAGNSKGNLYVQGSPNSSDPRTRCAIELGAPVPVTFIRSRSGTAIDFTVPDSLRHPLPTLSNALTDVTINIPRTTRRVNGRARGFLESVGGCSARRKNRLTITFTPESGPSQRAQHLSNCRR